MQLRLAALRSRLAAAGYHTPAAGRLATASAAGLVTGIDPADSLSSAAEVDAWLQRRTPEQALAELADAARQISDPALQNIALAIMTDIGLEAAAPHDEAAQARLVSELGGSPAAIAPGQPGHDERARASLTAPECGVQVPLGLPAVPITIRRSGRAAHPRT